MHFSPAKDPRCRDHSSEGQKLSHRPLTPLLRYQEGWKVRDEVAFGIPHWLSLLGSLTGAKALGRTHLEKTLIARPTMIYSATGLSYQMLPKCKHHDERAQKPGDAGKYSYSFWTRRQLPFARATQSIK